MQFNEINAAIVNQAVEIYLKHAYDDENLRQNHLVRFDDDENVNSIIDKFDYEKSEGPASYSLRLGCQHYPHMKLSLWEAYYKDEYIFAVDRHDGFDFASDNPDYESWIGIKSKNFHIKHKVENEWYESGIPTLRKLKEDCFSRSDIMREFSGQNILIVENDLDAAAIVSMILCSAGYGCIIADSCAKAHEIISGKGEDGNKHIGMALVDILLSDGCGENVVKAIRSESRTQDIPVLMSSAMNSKDVNINEADGYLRKPFSADKLIETVNNTIKKNYDGHHTMVDDIK